jgi:hypothetical protein
LQRLAIIDVPKTNKAAVKLVESFSFVPTFRPLPHVIRSRARDGHAALFGITTFELG